MIESSKDKIFGITSYCDTPEKVDVLIENINLIRSRFPEYKIALHANYPLTEDIQRMVDEYYYQDLNFTHNDKWIYYWNIISENEKICFKKKFFYSIQDTGFSVFQQIKALVRYLIYYEWVILINYDTSVEEIRIEDYSPEYDLTLHFFPDHKGVSLIIMSFNPVVFFNKVVKNFTYDNWSDKKRMDQLNEERFFDMVTESDINWFAHDYKISDKISGEPDYLKPNAPSNTYFTNYLIYHNNATLEVYLWGLLTNIRQMIAIDDNHQICYLRNQNEMGAFECVTTSSKLTPKTLHIIEIDGTPTNIELKFKKGYSTRDILENSL